MYSLKHMSAVLAGLVTQARFQRVLLVIVVLLVYATTLQNGFVLDDIAFISQNKFVQQGLKASPQIFLTPSLSGFVDRHVVDTAVNDIYRPLTLTVFAGEHQLFGDSAAWYHLVNLLLFAACVLVFYRLLMVFFARSDLLPFIAAMIFAVHPVHTEVVANIKSTDEMLCFLFAFLALLQFVGYATSGSTAKLLLAAFCYFLSLLSKETAVTLVVIVPLMAMVAARENKRRIWIATAIGWVMAAAFVALRYHVLVTHDAWHPGMIGFLENPLVEAPGVAARYATPLLIAGKYLLLLLCPWPLCSDYTYASIPFVGFDSVWVWVVIVAYTAMSLIALYRLRADKRDVYGGGIIFFIVTLSLFSNLIFLIGAIMADRFLFFPSAGFCLVAGAFVVHFLRYRVTRVAFAALLIIFASMTVVRSGQWKDNYTLFSSGVETQPQNARLWYGLGYELATTRMQDAPEDEQQQLLKESIACMQRSLAIYPDNAKEHMDIGNLFARIGQRDSALAHMHRALRLQPGNPVILSAMGGIYFGAGEYGETVALLRRALYIAPENVPLLVNLALTYQQLAIPDSAAYFAREVLNLQPGNTQARLVLETVGQTRH